MFNVKLNIHLSNTVASTEAGVSPHTTVSVAGSNPTLTVKLTSFDDLVLTRTAISIPS